MAIPAQLTYANEAEFIETFLIPLLHRLGFSVVVNTHGSREFGRDLVFGEIDRFGQVVYHGLQAKYVGSISLAGIEEIIVDARQAFNNPFLHPHKGNQEHISTFTAVNGGSIVEQAGQQFFNSLLQYRSNVRLLDGLALLALDKLAAMTRGQLVTERLTGLISEMRFNRQVIANLVRALEAFVVSGGPYPIFRLRSVALSAYLESPLAATQIPMDAVSECWQYVNMVNAAVDSLDSVIHAPDRNQGRLQGVKAIHASLIPLFDMVEMGAVELQNALQPLAGM